MSKRSRWGDTNYGVAKVVHNMRWRTNNINDGLQRSQDAAQHLGVLLSQVLIQHHTQVTHQLLLQWQTRTTRHQLVERVTWLNVCVCFVWLHSVPPGKSSWPQQYGRSGQQPVAAPWQICCSDATAPYHRSEAGRVSHAFRGHSQRCQNRSASPSPAEGIKLITAICCDNFCQRLS